MAKIAVIKTGGKQYKVAVGDTVKIEKLAADKGAKVKFDTLLVADGANLELGQPSLGERVEGEILDTAQDDKVTVVKYKSKTRYKKTVGHRQILTTVKISAIA